ncbi:MAG: hypothetical protein WCS84_12575 [Nocardioides sp.]
MSAGRATGHASLPDQLAFSKAHHTAQLWAPLLDDQAHLADTRGGHVIAAPYLDVLLTGAFAVVGDAYFDAVPEEASYHVQARLAFRSSSFWEDAIIGIRITTATTAGASSTTTTLDPFGRVSPAPLDRTADRLAAAKIRTLPYPGLVQEALTDAGEVTADHSINSALAAGLRRVTVEMYCSASYRGVLSAPPVYLRSLLVTGFRNGL